MKNSCFLLAFFFCMAQLYAQKNKADSFAALLAKEKTDSNKVTLLWNMADATNNYNPDTSLYLSQKSLYLAQKIKFTEGESRALGIIANTFLKIGNYPRALDFYLQKLKIEEKRDNPGNLASVIMNIGIVYVYQEEYRKALPYYFEADSIINAKNIEELKYNIAINLGDVYSRLHSNDTAFGYFKRSLDLANKIQDDNFRGASLVGLGHSYFEQGKDSLALETYHASMNYLKAVNNEELICEAALGIAKLYQRINKPDSAESYARMALALAQKDKFLSWQLEATTFLTNHFKQSKQADSTLVYLEQTQALKDSINSKDRIRESQVLFSNEQLRQNELAENRLKAKHERSKQLQLLFIGIFIPGLFLFTLFLSRRKVHIRFIKLMGILSLLILFEYLTLLLHPYGLEFTNHTPVFEIMIFVSIAAILIPTHHRIEHWLIEKLTQKRNRYEEGQFTIRKVRLKTKKPSN